MSENEQDTSNPSTPQQAPRVEPLPAPNPQLANLVIKGAGGKSVDRDKLAK